MKTYACLLKAVCFAFDVVGERQSIIPKKATKNLNDIKNVMDKLTFVHRNSFICRQQLI